VPTVTGGRLQKQHDSTAQDNSNSIHHQHPVTAAASSIAHGQKEKAAMVHKPGASHRLIAQAQNTKHLSLRSKMMLVDVALSLLV
jgi:hypothetical protein